MLRGCRLAIVKRVYSTERERICVVINRTDTRVRLNTLLKLEKRTGQFTGESSFATFLDETTGDRSSIQVVPRTAFAISPSVICPCLIAKLIRLLDI
jgi:hypothetical protein